MCAFFTSFFIAAMNGTPSEFKVSDPTLARGRTRQRRPLLTGLELERPGGREGSSGVSELNAGINAGQAEWEAFLDYLDSGVAVGGTGPGFQGRGILDAFEKFGVPQEECLHVQEQALV